MEKIIFNFDVIKHIPYRHIPSNEFYTVNEQDIERVRNIMHPVYPFVPTDDESVEVVALNNSPKSGGVYTLNEKVTRKVLIKDLESVWLKLPSQSEVDAFLKLL